jgi:hypothetical protein
MSKTTILAVTALLAVSSATIAFAHHSAAQFDFQNTINVKGVVKEARFSNPHARIVLEVSDAKGKRDIEFEGHSFLHTVDNIVRFVTAERGAAA